MVIQKAKSIAQLQREIASQRKRLAKRQTISKALDEKQRLSRELFELKNRGLIEAGSKVRRLSKRFGRGILRVGKKVAPVLQKQARLIREQQLRDDAIARRLSKRETPKVKRRKKSSKKTRRRKSKKKDKPSQNKKLKNVFGKEELILGGIGGLGDLAF